MILGIDEVGRGPWAGPLVVGAVVLGGAKIEGLTDSKKLTKKRREALDIEIRERAAGYGLGWVSAAEIDEIGLSQALHLACRRAVKMVDTLHIAYHEIIIDGTVNFLAGTGKARFVSTMKKVDLLVPSVSAASIIAKVARDDYMRQQGELYPEYGFGSNAGYGVAKHRAAIDKFGVTPEHRLSFAPLAKYRGSRAGGKGGGDLSVEEAACGACPVSRTPRAGVATRKEYSETDESPPPAVRQSAQTTRAIGDAGETAAAEALAADGHEIIARNWRTRWCEIDIVSKKGEILCFTEVKYRKNAVRGGGLEAITARKQRQIRFAAELFLAQNPHFGGYEIHLLAADVSGSSPPRVQQIVEIN